MNAFIRPLAAAALAILAVPLAAQQEVPMRGTTPVAPQGIKIPPLPDAPVRYETAEGQTIRVSVYARGFRNPWSMAFVVERHDPRGRTRRRDQDRAKRRGRSAAGAWRAGGPRGGTVGHGPGAAPGLRTQPRRVYQLHQAARRKTQHGGRGARDLGRQRIHRHEGHLRR